MSDRKTARSCRSTSAADPAQCSEATAAAAMPRRFRFGRSAADGERIRRQARAGRRIPTLPSPCRRRAAYGALLTAPGPGEPAGGLPQLRFNDAVRMMRARATDLHPHAMDIQPGDSRRCRLATAQASVGGIRPLFRPHDGSSPLPHHRPPRPGAARGRGRNHVPHRCERPASSLRPSVRTTVVPCRSASRTGEAIRADIGR